MKMKHLLIAVLLLPFMGMAQKGEYMNVSFASSFYKNSGTALGCSISGGFHPSKFSGLGAGFEVLKFKNVTEPYVPVYLDLSYVITPETPFKPFFMLQPGYGIYSDHTTQTVGSGRTAISSTTKGAGGFFIGTGFGVKFPGKIAPVISARYCLYEFNYSVTTNNSKINTSTQLDALSLSVGMSF